MGTSAGASSVRVSCGAAVRLRALAESRGWLTVLGNPHSPFLMVGQDLVRGAALHTLTVNPSASPLQTATPTANQPKATTRLT